jgi:hypothetical protein
MSRNSRQDPESLSTGGAPLGRRDTAAGGGTVSHDYDHDHQTRLTPFEHEHDHGERAHGGFPHQRLDAYRVALMMAKASKRVAADIPRGHRSVALVHATCGRQRRVTARRGCQPAYAEGEARTIRRESRGVCRGGRRGRSGRRSRTRARAPSRRTQTPGRTSRRDAHRADEPTELSRARARARWSRACRVGRGRGAWLACSARRPSCLKRLSSVCPPEWLCEYGVEVLDELLQSRSQSGDRLE